MGSLKDDLAQSAQELRETHISWVFLHEHDVYKVKKPVQFGFLDFSTLELRRRACVAEVELNRRLALDVYDSVVPVCCEHGHHTLGGTGTPVDWAVKMVRLPDAARGDAMLAENAFGIAHVDQVAARLAEFHARARCDSEIARQGEPEAIARAVRENFEQAHPAIEEYLGPHQVAEIETWQREFVARHEALLRARVQQGRIREGHGDLKLEHVYFTARGLSVIDCIEFNAAFRYLDVCSDVAFLAMDLSAHGRVDLAERLLSSYARASHDYDVFGLVDFYESYRAYVRGKVAALLARDPGAPLTVRSWADQQARHYFLLALASERRSLLDPMVVAVGGLMGSGKSTLSDGLSLQLGGAVVSSDPVRKHLLAVDERTPLTDAPFRGAYDPATSERVYTELLRRGRAVVESGRPVVLDASFRSRHERGRARALARSLGVPFCFVECRASREICRARLAQRVQNPHESDGRPEILDAFADGWERVDELSEDEYLAIDTSGSVGAGLDVLASRLPVWPERF